MKLFLAGLNHRTAPVEVRERLAIPEADLAAALDDLRTGLAVDEALILSTCNRVEIAAVAEREPDLPGFLAKTREVDRQWLLPHMYRFEGADALRHLFRVASSLDSMVVGEPQILGQLKAAYQVAKQQGAVFSQLETLVSRAFNVAKRVRTETAIGESAVSISYAAVELANQIFGSLQGRRVLLIGAGKMSELAARHLRRSGAKEISVTNRTRSRAEEMAALFHGTVIDYEAFKAHLPETDIIITSSGAPNYLLEPRDVRQALDRRRHRPMFFIDIAVPRNVHPAVNELDNAFLYDIDDLQQVVSRNVDARKREAEQAEEIVAEEVERVLQQLRTREVAPTIVGLQEQLEQIRSAEVERLRGKLGTLSPQQEEALEQLTKGIVSKIAHVHIAALRTDAARPGGGQMAQVIRSVFRLNRTPKESDK
jgi:glutamyl-tRNA reductase